MEWNPGKIGAGDPRNAMGSRLRCDTPTRPYPDSAQSWRGIAAQRAAPLSADNPAVAPIIARVRHLLSAGIGIVAATPALTGQRTIGGTYINRGYQEDSKDHVHDRRSPRLSLAQGYPAMVNHV